MTMSNPRKDGVQITVTEHHKKLQKKGVSDLCIGKIRFIFQNSDLKDSSTRQKKLRDINSQQNTKQEYLVKNRKSCYKKFNEKEWNETF
mgnify:CR=1 FL=1